MRSDRDFDLVCESISKKASKIWGTDNPELPGNVPNCSLWQYFSDGREVSNTANTYYPLSAHLHFKAIYSEAINSICY